MFTHHVSYALCKYFPILNAFVCMLLQHQIIRGEFWQYVDGVSVSTQTRYHQDEIFWKAKDVIARTDPPLCESDVTWSYSSHCLKCTSFKFEYVGSISCCPFWEYTERIPVLTMFFYLNSSLFEYL